MSLLTLVKRACALCSVAQPNTVMGASGGVGATMAALAQIEGEELMRRHEWRQVRGEVKFPATGEARQLGRVPEDFDRMVSDTVWNRSTNTPLAGPADAAMWARASTDLGAPLFRLFTQDMHILPAPAGGETIAFEYISSAFVETAAGEYSPVWTADDDKSRLPEHLLVFGLVWRWKASKGLDYGEDMATYERAIERATADDYGSISTASCDDDYRPPLPSVIVYP
jgi:hypothetical protein